MPKSVRYTAVLPTGRPCEHGIDARCDRLGAGRPSGALQAAGSLVVAVLLQVSPARAQSIPGWVYNEGFANDPESCDLSVRCSFSAPSQVAVGANLTAVNPSPNAQDYPVSVDISGTMQSSDDPATNAASVASLGEVGSEYVDANGTQRYNGAAEVTLSVEADAAMDALDASGLMTTMHNPLYAVTGGGAFMAASLGADGYADGNENPPPGIFDGGAGGSINLFHDNADLKITGSGEILDPFLIPAYVNGLGAFSIGGDGVAIKAHDDDWAGNGGDGGDVYVDFEAGSTLALSNAYGGQSNGIFAYSRGGVGANQKNYAIGDGGNGGAVTVDVSGSIVNSAFEGVGVLAVSQGGDSDFDNQHGGSDASGAGDGGTVSVTVEDGGSIDMTGSVGIGVMALSTGGDADYGWNGGGGTVTVEVDQGGSISTGGGSLAIGVLAASAGSMGDLRPFDTVNVNSAYPGVPGDVTVTNAGSISSEGSMAIGIAALGVGGSLIGTNADSSGTNILGGSTTSEYGGFDGSTVSVTNSGSIQTFGGSAHGILALSAGGGGGLLNQDAPDLTTEIGSDMGGNTPGSNAAAVSVTNSGSIQTGDGQGGGTAAIGIVAQSVGGGGGSSNAPAFFVGGHDPDGSGGGDGGSVTVTTTAGSSVATLDETAIGILAQSIGGGGGNGANEWGVFAAVGGQGGNGGDGGDVVVNLDNRGQGGITTVGDFSIGLVGQSIGGGGGNGGAAKTASPVLFSVGIGGAGGGGGNAGEVDVTSSANLRTAGNQAFGILAQSAGGGGGNGGSAASYDASGGIAIAVAVGGSGGDGGDGGSVAISNSGLIQTGCAASAAECSYSAQAGSVLDAADAIGILAQSIGGGGGNGGSATATSWALPADDIPSISFAFSLGGSGGSGGYGDEVTLGNTGAIWTGGDAAYGLVAQSIGGGGGNAGDSTANSYALEGEMPSVKIALAIGGSGGSGGSGGPASITNGDTSDSTVIAQINTFGQFASGLVAQSIGGGGGTGASGTSSASSQNLGDDTGTAVDVSFGLGGSGGGGGWGGVVTITNSAGGSIVTTGSTARGILAQSIGGGGGAAAGGNAGSSGDTVNLNLSVGGSGGVAGDGGDITITNDGNISTGALLTDTDGNTLTTGGDAVGILAQSIGGGGGVGGSSDTAATIGPVGQYEDLLNPPSNSYEANIGVGGSGGAAGEGGGININNTGSIQTLGIRAYGILAQSIGGGGGSGGAATSTSNSVLGGSTSDGKAGTYSADISVGGSGGASGDGGSVSISNSGSILTAGYGAHAILAHSVGGGGGVGAEGSVDNSTSIGLGASLGGDGASGGYGGPVDIDENGTLWTAGDDAYGILAQSIGGGGGTAGVGCSNSGPSGPTGNSASLCLGNSGNGVDASTSLWNDSSDFSLILAGAPGVYGDGEDVDISKGAGSIVTTGARAMGIAAQSIGGGGGLVSSAATNIDSAALQLWPNTVTGNGGSVSVELADGASITTYGDGAWGLFAQSVGGGGGFAGDPSAVLQSAIANSVILSDQLPSGGNGGDIQIGISGNISTSGANAHGIVAQSVGGGGGIVYSANGWLEAQNSAQGMEGSFPADYSGSGGSISITQAAGSSIQLTGPASIGIVAQSTGTSNDPGVISITINGLVQGGSSEAGIGNGAGIVASGGVFYGSETYTNVTNSITIGSTGSVGSMAGANGWAIVASQGIFNLTNEGTITGAIDLGSGTGQSSQISADSHAGAPGNISNQGTINSGYMIGTFYFLDYGRLSIYGDGKIGTTSITQSSLSLAPPMRYDQEGSGVLAVDIDALATQTADLLAVDGMAQMTGSIVPTPINLLPREYQVVSTTTGFQGEPITPSRLLFDWSLDISNSGVTLSPVADFTPSGASLTHNETAVANYLQSTWEVDGSTALAPVYADLYQVQDASDFQALLDNLSSQNIVAQASDQALGARTGLDASMSCPAFEGDGTLLRETTCAWVKATRTHTERHESSASPSYDIDGWSLRAGGQYALGNDWFAGATLAYNSSNINADRHHASSDGEGFDVGLALKRQLGNWLIAGGLNLGQGWYDNQRTFLWQDHQGRLSSSSRISHLGARLRAAYEIPFERWYLRPRLDLDLLHTRMPSYRESGDDWFALDIEAQRNTSFAIAPVLEGGARLDLDNGWVGRLYVAAGATWLADERWETEARLVGAPDAAGTFKTENRLPRTLGSLDLGLQLYRSDAFEARLEYGLQSGEDYLNQNGSLRLAYRF